LAPGRSLLEPAIRTTRALDRLSAASRSALRARLEAWVETMVARHLDPLRTLANAATDPASSPGVRAFAAMLSDAGGVLPRRSMAATIGTLEQEDRRALHKLRVRLGPLDLFLPQLLKPAAQHWRAALASVRSGLPMPKLPAPGAAMLAADADARGAALAYRRVGGAWIRIDLADRLASHAHKVRSAGGQDVVDVALATSIGLDDEGLARLMADVGFARAGDAWRWRGRRPPREQPRKPQAANAFAELAKLKR
jgi:ATP-dependent RNA helicase SUPV3L1/SUV3